MRTTTRRVAALVAAPALALGLVSGFGPAAQAAPGPSSTSAASWLTTQLSNGLFRPGGTVNYSVSIDIALGQLEGGNPAVATQIRDAIAPSVNDYIQNGATQYGVRTAQVLDLVQATGGNGTAFGGVNLVSRLESLTAADGKLTDSNGGSYSAYGQALGVDALTAAKSPEAAQATAFLLGQQCPAGFFIPFEGTACGDESAPDTDATAQAVLGLQGRLAEPNVKAAVDRAIAWLKARQAADGSFIGSSFVPSANTNSTGLAAAALGASCEVGAADRAGTFLRSLQVPAGTTGPLATAVGAVAYDQATLTDGRTNGIDPADVYSWRLPTAQAALGLPWDKTAKSELRLRGPKGGYVKAGATSTFRIKGAPDGERVCVTTPTGTQAVTVTGGKVEVTVKTRRKATEAYTVSATTGPGEVAKTVTPLPRTRLKAAFAKRVERGDRVVVKVRKLASKERARIVVDGKVVAKGKANAKGVFVARFRARYGLGQHKLVAQGAYGNRKAVYRFTVTR
ncbi:hypothetical protein [Nocardioides flavescens]|uniref:Terpene cyclase/mutase family protein n=1 Tax=Nocardioides flavescens TaxID=2691959 RepID=A0A6L7ERF0_9ACTN|nr:hypothetical protein [Nocardioides flavescens]MXG88166.1 hypothetical protein [Nocardioides flavescens]